MPTPDEARIALIDAFWRWVWVNAYERRPRPSRPGKPGARQIAFDHGTHMLTYKLILPPATAPDVDSFTAFITTKTGEADPVVKTIAHADDTSTFTAEVGDAVSIQVSETDKSGNESEKSDPYAFTASDTLPPPKPGQPGAVLVSDQS